MEPDAIVVPAGGIKQDESGRWVSTDLSASDNAQGAPGGKLRVFAAVALGNQYPVATVLASGGRGGDVPSQALDDRPSLADILREELVACGLPAERVALDQRSCTTYQQLTELAKLIDSRGWRSVLLVTNRYHVPRVGAFIEERLPGLAHAVRVIAAEDVLLGADPARWEAVITTAYASQYMTERITTEQQGIEQIRNGTYRFQ